MSKQGVHVEETIKPGKVAPMKAKQQEMFEPEKEQEPIRIFTDGAGAGPDRKGSAYAFQRADTGEKRVLRADGLTNNQAEYMAIILALESLLRGEGTVWEICSDSDLVISQLNGRYSVRDPQLAKLCASVHQVIEKKDLNVRFVWVRREENLAGKLL